MNHATDDFLPREYIEHRQDRRMHIAATALFIVVVASPHRIGAQKDRLSLRGRSALAR